METKQKMRKNLGMGSLAVALIFLFNPDIAVVDVLPDFLGYIFLYFGMLALSDMDDHMAEARDYFRKLTWLSGARMLSILFIFAVLPAGEQPIFMCTICMIISIGEICFLLPAWKNFFEGLTYLSMRNGGSYILGTKPFRPNRALSNPNLPQARLKKLQEKDARRRAKHESRNRTESLCRFTQIFLVLKAVLSVLPEFSALSTGSDGGFPFYTYINMFRIFAAVAVAVVGIVWLLKAERYFAGVRGDRPFIEGIEAKYRAEVLPKTHIFVNRRLKLCFLLFSFGVAFFMDWWVDSVNILPDVIGCLLLIVGVLLAREHLQHWVPVVAITGVYGVYSLLTEIFTARYLAVHDPAAEWKRANLDPAFWQISALTVVQSVLFVLMMAAVIWVLYGIVRRYTGFLVREGDSQQPSTRVQEIRRQLTKRTILTFVFLVLQAVMGSVYFLSLPYSALYNHFDASTIIYLIFEMTWMFNLIAGAVAAILFIRLLTRLFEEVRACYRYA